MSLRTLLFTFVGCALAAPVLAAVDNDPIELSPKVRQRCLEVLRAGLASDEFWPAMHAAEALTLAGLGDEVRHALTDRLQTVTDDQHRCGVARELVRAGQAERAADMLAILASDDTYAHTHAAESLYKVSQAGDGSLLRKALARDELPKLQLMAAAALIQAGNPELLKFVRQRLADPQVPENRQIAAWILARVGNQSDIAQLLENRQRETDPTIKAYQEHALACLGDSTGLAALEANLKHVDDGIRTYAAEIVGHARAAPMADRLIELLDDPCLDVRIRAAQSLLVLAQRPAEK